MWEKSEVAKRGVVAGAAGLRRSGAVILLQLRLAGS